MARRDPSFPSRASFACVFSRRETQNCCPSDRSGPGSGSFRRRPLPTGRYSEDQVAKLSGLGVEQLRTLALYDVLSPTESGLSYTDLIVARAVGRLSGDGAAFPKIIAAALALEERGMSLSEVRLAKAPWGELVQVLDGGVAQVDGQLVLSLEGSDVNSDEAFAGAEAYEQAGDLEQAERLYDLATRLDKADPVIPFNLGNVLDELGREREAEIAYRQAIARDPIFRTHGSISAYFRRRSAGSMKRCRATRGPSPSSPPMRTPSTTAHFCLCASVSSRRL